MGNGPVAGYMDPELRRYLQAMVVLQSLTVGYLLTILWTSGQSVSLAFLVVPPLLVGGVAGAAVRYAVTVAG